jgi:hypothetical protein
MRERCASCLSASSARFIRATLAGCLDFKRTLRVKLSRESTIMNHNWLLIALPPLMLVALNIKASVALARANCYERKQKIIQFVLVWALPVLGGLLVWMLARSSSATEISAPCAASDGFERNRNEETSW